MGVRLIDDFLARNSNIGRCNDFRETADVLAKVTLDAKRLSRSSRSSSARIQNVFGNFADDHQLVSRSGWILVDSRWKSVDRVRRITGRTRTKAELQSDDLWSDSRRFRNGSLLFHLSRVRRLIAPPFRFKSKWNVVSFRISWRATARPNYEWNSSKNWKMRCRRVKTRSRLRTTTRAANSKLSMRLDPLQSFVRFICIFFIDRRATSM